jgi:hypothetical protein
MTSVEGKRTEQFPEKSLNLENQSQKTVLTEDYLDSYTDIN